MQFFEKTLKTKLQKNKLGKIFMARSKNSANQINYMAHWGNKQQQQHKQQ